MLKIAKEFPVKKLFPIFSTDSEMKTRFNFIRAWRYWACAFAAITAFLANTPAQSQPTILSVTPTNLSTGVSITNPVIITFSESMDVSNSGVAFFDETMFGSLSVSLGWSANNTVLTCTPDPPFPSESEILWVVDAHDTNGNAVEGSITGFYQTGSTNGLGASPYTSFSVLDSIYYAQTSAGPPVSDPLDPYLFLASAVLASNSTALSASVILPSGSVSNLSQSMTEPSDYFVGEISTNQTALDTLFGNGNYAFTIVTAASTQQATVDLPASLAQPGAPHIANYTAAQSVDPAQPFALEWDAFPGGTASDFIYVSVGAIYTTAMPGAPNALPGTATSFSIPAGTLKSGKTYDTTVAFYHAILATNIAAGYATSAIRDSVTHFNLITAGGGTAPLVLANVAFNGHTITFSLTAATNQTVIIQSNTNITLATSQWQTLLATNSPTGFIQVNEPVNPAFPGVFYRAVTAP
jgi:hypothetical protein